MSKRLWFYLDDTLALAEHAAAASAFDRSDDDSVDEPALMLVAGNGISLRSNGLPAPTGEGVPAATYAQGAPTDRGPEMRRAAGLDIVLFLPVGPDEPDSLLRSLRAAAADGDGWFVVAINDDDSTTLYTRRTLEAVTNDNARWAPAAVQVFGVLGPYEAQIADGHRWFGWMVPRFTRPVTESIIADVTALARNAPTSGIDGVRWRGNTVEVISGQGTATERVEVIPPDAGGMFAVGARAWCWETATPDWPAAADLDANSGAPAGTVSCLCPRRCLLCGEPADTHHDLDCPWWLGSADGENPRLARQPLVLAGHVHRPGCRHAQPHPGGLCEQLTEEGDTRCLICGAINSQEADSFPSFGGTTEYHCRCTACGSRWSFCDLSAIR